MAVRRIFFDSNAIIEAHRTRCWNVIVGHHRIETVGIRAKNRNGPSNRQPTIQK